MAAEGARPDPDGPRQTLRKRWVRFEVRRFRTRLQAADLPGGAHQGDPSLPGGGGTCRMSRPRTGKTGGACRLGERPAVDDQFAAGRTTVILAGSTLTRSVERPDRLFL